jgi:hypothetical protein
VPVSREHRRAKSDRLDIGLLKRSSLGWLRGEEKHCTMVAIPTSEEEDAKRPNREREHLVGRSTSVTNRLKATLVRLGIRGVNPWSRTRAAFGGRLAVATAILDRGCARHRQGHRLGQRNGLLQPNKETSRGPTCRNSCLTSTRPIQGSAIIFYVGNLKGVVRVYQQTFIDTCAKIGFAKLYDRKTPITAADVLKDRRSRFMRSTAFPCSAC